MEKIIGNLKYIIKHLFENGDCLCDIVELSFNKLDGSEEFIMVEGYKGTDLVVSDLEFTDEEKAILLPSEPVLTLDDYKAEKLAKLADFDKSEAVNSFTIQGQKMWLDNDTRRKLKFRIDAEKASGKTETTLWFGGIAFTFPIDLFEMMLNGLEVYASECYDKTQEHERSIKALESVEAVKSYDFTTDYPQKLAL